MANYKTTMQKHNLNVRLQIDTLRPRSEEDFDYINITIYLFKFYLSLEFLFFPLSAWSWECRNIGDSCFLLRHTQFDIVFPTLEFKYQHFL